MGCVTAVTDKQVQELDIWVVDGNLVIGQNQNAAPMVAREMLRLAAERVGAPV